MIMKLLRESESQKKIDVNWSQKFLQRRSKLVLIFSQALNKKRAVMHNDQIINA